jgi:hypothetical protein
VGDLAKPFPHATDWNLPESFWKRRPEPPSDVSFEEEDRLMAAWDSLLEENYWSPACVNGAIPICHLGCALRQWLVICGEQRGFVWRDDRVDEKGLYPSRDKAGMQVTFADWYTSWINDALAQVGSQHRVGLNKS